MSNSRLIVGLGTRDRPKMLDRALKSLEKLEYPDGAEVILVLCDNSTLGEAKEIYQKYKEELSILSYYLHETNSGIVNMRNQILKKALELKGDYLAFFDDDSTVEKNWLVNLYNCMHQYQAQVVQGCIDFIFPKTENLSLLKKYYPGITNAQTGDELQVAFTHNVLVDLSEVHKHSLLFDVRLNLCGGSDTLFFRQLKQNGVKIIFCREALVLETVPASRASWDWLEMRFYRNGYTSYYIDLILSKKKLNPFGLISGLWAVIWTKVLGSLKRLVNSSSQYQARKNHQKARGKIHAMLGRKFEEYRRVHGE